MAVCLFATACLLSVIIADSAIVNKEITRNFDASSAIVRLTVDIKAEGIQDRYLVAFPDDVTSKIAFISAKSKSERLNVLPPTTINNISHYMIMTEKPIASLRLFIVFTSLLVPRPASIKQNDHQLVHFIDSCFFFSPYFTDTQTTVVKLASNAILSYTKLEPFSTRGANVLYGPYVHVAPYSTETLTVHYVNNHPFMEFTSSTREIDVSLWSATRVEEVVDLRHAGAMLTGGFSRFDYQLQHDAATPSYRSLRATLPLQASDIYYRDQIGNISSSGVAITKDAIQLTIDTRYPMFGGWKSQFYIGYTTPTDAYLTQTNETDRYYLMLDAFSHFEDVWVDDMCLKVVLPEGATDITFDTPFVMEARQSKRPVFLDSVIDNGRHILIFEAKNLVEEHRQLIRISFTVNKSRRFIKHLMLLASALALVVTCLGFSSLSL